MKKRKDTNLAEGEVTGHAHRCSGDDVSVFDCDGGLRLLNAPYGCEVTHEEHKTVHIEPGQYDIVIAQEYDPFEDEARKVAD
mgnify:CR=1 FL=1|jgi:hypothetical protein